MSCSIKIDNEKCIGCGTCVALCPENFVLEGDKAKVTTSDVDDCKCIEDAKSSCPTDAIIIEEK